MSSDPLSSSLTATADFTGRAAAKPSFYRGAILRAFSAMTRGHLRIELPDGTVHEIGDHTSALALRLPLALPATAHLRVRREAFFKKCLLSGDIGFAESFIDGDWETPHLAAVIAWFLHNVDHAPTLSGSAKNPRSPGPSTSSASPTASATSSAPTPARPPAATSPNTTISPTTSSPSSSIPR